MLGLAVLLALGNWIGLLERPPAVKSPPGFDGRLLDIDAPMVRRPNYNYSVISGGAFTGPEFERAVSRDRVVAQHYSSVNASTMRPEILKADRLAYVSYRIGDRVYWTSKKVRIRSGETILTNGQTEVRARCGNCISMEPLMPTSADEPDAMQLDALTDTGPVLVAWSLNPLAPLAPGGPVGLEMLPLVTPHFGLPLFPFPSGFPVAPTAGAPGDTEPVSPIAGALPEAAPGVGVDTTPPGGGTPPGGVAPPGATGPTVPGFSIDGPFPPDRPDSLLDAPTTRVPPPTPPTDVTPVPEPATLLLLGGGIAGLMARRWSSRRV